MQPFPTVLIQTVLTVAVGVAVLVAGGDQVAALVLVVLAVAATVWLFFATQYYVRRFTSDRAVSQTRLHGDNLVLLLGAVCFVVPAAVAVWMLVAQVGGVLFTSTWASVAAIQLLIVILAIVTSSAVDWYLITPFQRGVLRRPMCDRDIDVATRTNYAKWWIVHRGLCELVAYTSFAVFVLISLQALSSLIATDSVLRDALAPFLAALPVGYFWLQMLKKRTFPAWDYLNQQSAGLGSWAKQTGGDGQRQEGFVVDVSVSPGIQLRRSPREAAAYVPLTRAGDVQSAAPRRLCVDRCEQWVPFCDAGLRQREAAKDEPAT